eukprot:3901741-Amphidinium_carterae.1
MLKENGAHGYCQEDMDPIPRPVIKMPRGSIPKTVWKNKPTDDEEGFIQDEDAEPNRTWKRTESGEYVICASNPPPPPPRGLPAMKWMKMEKGEWIAIPPTPPPATRKL